MKILFLNQQFQSPAGCSISRGYEFVKCLRGFGHDVRVVCSGIETEDDLTCRDGETVRETAVDGIPCTSIAAGWGSPIAITKVHLYRRMLGFLNFARLATKVCQQQDAPDLVYASSPPLPIGLAGRNLSRHFGVPFVFEVRDPWPQALIDLGALKNPAGIAWMRWLERRIYNAADHFVALSPGIQKSIAGQGIPSTKITVVPNASDLELFGSGDAAIGKEALELGDEDFTVIYFGAMGMANGLDYFLDAAKILKSQGNDRIKFRMVGTGGDREQLQNRVREEGLSNVRMYDPVPRTRLPDLIAACDICTTIIRPSTEDPTWSPNKLFDSLAAGKPVVANVRGWIADLIRENECGRTTEPTDSESFAATLQALAADPGLCEQYSKNARRLAEDEYARERLAVKLEASLLQLCDSQSTVSV